MKNAPEFTALSSLSVQSWVKRGQRKNWAKLVGEKPVDTTKHHAHIQSACEVLVRDFKVIVGGFRARVGIGVPCGKDEHKRGQVQVRIIVSHRRGQPRKPRSDSPPGIFLFQETACVLFQNQSRLQRVRSRTTEVCKSRELLGVGEGSNMDVQGGTSLEYKETTIEREMI